MDGSLLMRVQMWINLDHHSLKYILWEGNRLRQRGGGKEESSMVNYLGKLPLNKIK